MTFVTNVFIRLKPEVEKQELELFKQGQFVIEDEEKEDASAPTADRPVPPEVLEVCFLIYYLFIFYLSISLLGCTS